MPQAVELRDAATVMLVRGAPLEVFLLRRNLASDFVGGAWVFPGGAVDPHDRHGDLEPHCAGRTDTDASDRLDLPHGGLAFWVAAIRESFEEAGVLLAYEADGTVVRLVDHDPDTAERFLRHRADVDSGARRLVDVCADEGLRLAVDSLYYFAHWITPEGAPRRYDTRFFVAAAPDGQVPLHDDHELVESQWIRPVDALARYEAGDLELIFPTMRSLVAISQFPSAQALLAHAALIDDVPAILPRIVDDEQGGLRIVLPDDAEFASVASAALPAEWAGIPVDRLRPAPVRHESPTLAGASVGSLGTAERGAALEGS